MQAEMPWNAWAAQSDREGTKQVSKPLLMQDYRHLAASPGRVPPSWLWETTRQGEGGSSSSSRITSVSPLLPRENLRCREPGWGSSSLCGDLQADVFLGELREGEAPIGERSLEGMPSWKLWQPPFRLKGKLLKLRKYS